MIQRYSMTERIMHWLAAAAYFYVMLTGLAFYSPHFYWLATALGGGPTSRYWHPIVALLFLVTLVWMIVAWRRDMRFTPVDRAWQKAGGHYARNEDDLVPPVDRFNAGQKQFYWAMVVAGAVLLVTGLAMWIPDRIAPVLRQASVLLHAAAALVTIGAMIVHIYMGAAVVPGSVTAMVRGYVTREWAQHHHRLWYERVTGSRTEGK